MTMAHWPLFAMLDYDCLIVLDGVAFGDDDGRGRDRGVCEFISSMDWNN